VKRQRISVQELRRKIVAELDRELGARGTVIDIDIVALDHAGGGPTWGLSRISDEASPQALRKVLSTVVPRLQAEYDAEFG
jgi:hypothetical protein